MSICLLAQPLGPFIYKVTGGPGEFMGSPQKYLSVGGEGGGSEIETQNSISQ